MNYLGIKLCGMDIQQRIFEIRAAGLSQAEIACRIGVSQGAVSHYETGRRKRMYSDTHEKLIALYQELFGSKNKEAA